MRKISIVTVTYNSASTLRDTIESVLAQTYQNIEYIIVDGLSKDNTMDIVREYEPKFNGRMRYVSERDSGLYDAMNKGFKIATGEVVGLINSDDLLAEPTAIEKVMRCFENNQNADAVYADLYYVAQYDTSKIVRYWKSGKQRPFKYGWHPAHPTFYVKKEIYQRYDTFNLKYKLAADFELMLRLIERYKIKIVYLPEPLVRMRLGGATSKNWKNIRKQNLECMQAFKDNKLPVLPKLKQYISSYKGA